MKKRKYKRKRRKKSDKAGEKPPEDKTEQKKGSLRMQAAFCIMIRIWKSFIQHNKRRKKEGRSFQHKGNHPEGNQLSYTSFL